MNVHIVKDLIAKGQLYFIQHPPKEGTSILNRPVLHVENGEPMQKLKALGIQVTKVRTFDPVVGIESLKDKIGYYATKVIDTIPVRAENAYEFTATTAREAVKEYFKPITSVFKGKGR